MRETDSVDVGLEAAENGIGVELPGPPGAEHPSAWEGYSFATLTCIED